MPYLHAPTAPVSKVSAVESTGAYVTLGGTSVDDCAEEARAYAAKTRAHFIHPFDDLDVLAGQGTLGLELLDQVPDMQSVILPVGGGGLGGATALAIKEARPEGRIVGVQAEGCAPYLTREPVARIHTQSLADGIAIKRPGEISGPLVERCHEDLVAVDEAAIAEAMVLILERLKVSVEGAGAVALAAVLSGQVAVSSSPSVLVLSGGNLDIGVLAKLTQRQKTPYGSTRRSRGPYSRSAWRGHSTFRRRR